MRRMLQQFEPFYLPPGEAVKAHKNALTEYSVAYGPKPIDDEHVDEFIDRWAGRLASASEGKMSQPPQLPIPD